MKIKIKENLKEKLTYLVALGGLIFFLCFVTTATFIRYEVKERCDRAIEVYGGECVDALIAKLEDEKTDLAEKNRMIWTLGQLGDRKALPVLKKYYTGEPCDHDRILCQYELSKAIKLLKGGFNATSIFWKEK